MTLVAALPPRLRIVEPKPEERYVTCVPLVPLKAAAGAFSDPQHIEDDDWEWVAVDTRHRLRPGMFVAQVVGKSMEPAIPDGSYCLFAAPVDGHAAGQDRARPTARRRRPRDRRALHRQALREREGRRMATPGATAGSP